MAIEAQQNIFHCAPFWVVLITGFFPSIPSQEGNLRLVLDTTIPRRKESRDKRE